MNNEYADENNSWCYFHPKEAVVGVCPLCLNERLLVLASKQGHVHHHSSSSKAKVVSSDKKPPSKVFAFRSLLNRFEFRHWKSGDDHDHHDDACSSQEDSFISIKFEENGVASWEKGTVSKVSLEHCSMSWSKEQPKHRNKSQSVIEHAKPRGSLRWLKRIGHLMQLLRWKRSSKVAVEAGGVKVMRKGWIRTLTKRGPRNKGIL